MELEVESDKLDRRQSKVAGLAYCSPPVSVTAIPDAGYKYHAKVKCYGTHENSATFGST